MGCILGTVNTKWETKMINIELEIEGEEVACCYQREVGEISMLFMLMPDENMEDVSFLLEFDHIYNAIDDHFANLMKDEFTCH